MERVFAFIDESGNSGFDFSKDGVSSYFIISAITVKESDKQMVENAVEEIRRKHFKNSEIKSSKIKSNNKRRCQILSEIKKLPLHAFVLVVDKRKIYADSGIKKNKGTFYKFLNNILYDELRRNFCKLEIVADEVGDNEFIKGFTKYVKSKENLRSLFDEYNFSMSNSQSSILVQVADLISGSLSYTYEPNKISKAEGFNYIKILGKTILLIKEFPKNYKQFLEDESIRDPRFNKQIFEIAYRRAIDFINSKNIDISDSDTTVAEQKFVLEYLFFRFTTNPSRRYIGTRELIAALEKAGYKRRNPASFRMKIIGKLRDSGVIISSSPQGYKLPTSMEELCDYITHTKTVIIPMISRLKVCIKAINAGSNGDIDLTKISQFSELKQLLDTI